MTDVLTEIQESDKGVIDRNILSSIRFRHLINQPVELCFFMIRPAPIGYWVAFYHRFHHIIHPALIFEFPGMFPVQDFGGLCGLECQWYEFFFINTTQYFLFYLLFHRCFFTIQPEVGTGEWNQQREEKKYTGCFFQ